MVRAFLQCESHPGRPLVNHLADVAERLADDRLRLAAIFHDIGKATQFFQDYISGKPFSDPLLKAHARLGAFWLLSHLCATKNPSPLEAVIPYLLVRNHHTGLEDARDALGTDEKEVSRWKRQMEALDVSGASEWLVAKLLEPPGVPSIEQNWAKLRVQLTRALESASDDDAAMRRFQGVLRSFGQLIEADRDSASTFARGYFDQSPQLTKDLVVRFRKAKGFGSDGDPIAIARNLVFASAVEKATALDAASGHLWSLTVPTGSGKTLAAIGWAVRRREARIQAGQPNCPIIYALPFTSIIDQNAAIIRELFSDAGVDESNLAIHHHVAEPGELAQKGEESLARSWVEGWRADVVCTTFVQVVNALFHGAVADARRFSKLAGSILILDEVQAIPAEYWPVVRSALWSLATNWGTDILLVTATQPAIFDADSVSPIEPVFPEAVATAFDRYDVAAEVAKTIGLEQLCGRVVESVAQRPDTSCLVILNTVQEALDLHNTLVSVVPSVPLFHLSTNLRPKDRKVILRKITESRGQAHILVSTQVVEAGVDLSFDHVIRALAPLDSIVQAAGRCNRHGSGRRGEVLVVKLEKSTEVLIYGALHINVVHHLLSGTSGTIPEPALKKLVVEYFKEIRRRKEWSKARKIMEAVRMLEFGALRGRSDDRNREKEVRLIVERGDTIPHFVEIDESDSEVWLRFLDALDLPNPFQRRGRLRQLRPELGKRIVEVPFAHRANDVSEHTGLVHVPSEAADQYYDLNTGWKRARA